MHKWGTKAETLAFLYERQKEIGAKILKPFYFSVDEWQKDPTGVWRQVSAKLNTDFGLIVRSSAQNEDSRESSHAGEYDSFPCGGNEEEFKEATNKVIASYGKADPCDQVLTQPLLTDVDAAGVAFTIDPNGGGQYYVISYDESGSTSAVTGGQSKAHKLLYVFKDKIPQDNSLQARLCRALKNSEQILETEALDVEFAFRDKELYLFQARPLCIKTDVADLKTQADCLESVAQYIQTANMPKPFLYGEKTLYSNMTDWNPAEMIGTHPKNLAMSLYKELITDSTWAYQRDNYGYMRLRSFPLMVDFCGCPYIDVRVSFNSFVPADLSPSVAEKLVNYYLRELAARPEKHDKVEFDIIFSCYTFDLPKRIMKLRERGFMAEEVEEITSALRRLTNRIINSKTGLWKKDAQKIRILEERYSKICASSMSEVEKMYWLIEDCKRYGTLPFAGLARAGFIAVQLLQSMVKENIIDRADYDSFMREIDTIGSKIKRDYGNLTKSDFLKRYGHLRPGTYDITSARYDENPDLYFNWENKNIESSDNDNSSTEGFRLSLSQLSKIKAALEEHGLDDDVLGLFEFIRAAIEGREMAKFMFTKNLSETLRLFGVWGQKYGFSADDCAYADIGTVKIAYESTPKVKLLLKRAMENGRMKYEESRFLVLPPLISSPKDVSAFYMPDSRPTFVTQKRAQGLVMAVERQADGEPEGKILLIPAADPGYDWIFSHNIAGFITEYGGANSHMAIRAGELGIPAVIGAGEKLFLELSQAEAVEIDAALSKVTVLR